MSESTKDNSIEELKNLEPLMICNECHEPIQVGQDYTYLEDGTIIEHTTCLEMRGAVE